ncbi:MAG: Rrf2 family transcriptional regulator [Ignavibacteriaceae bacterium]|nr:Rrf2 family transcriptional regulator [Ignavibacteriaceae bacterium]
MSASTKLSTAVKAVCFLSTNYPQPKSSPEIAENIGINPSKLRKILSMLVKNGIVKSTHGISGGFTLNRNSSELHVQEIYCAIEDRKAFYLDVQKEDIKKNSMPAKVNSYFLELFSDIQVDIEDKMKNITIKSVLEKINNRK